MHFGICQSCANFVTHEGWKYGATREAIRTLHAVDFGGRT